MLREKLWCEYIRQKRRLDLFVGYKKKYFVKYERIKITILEGFQFLCQKSKTEMCTSVYRKFSMGYAFDFLFVGLKDKQKFLF